jgi:hypothetical protein
MSVVRQLAHELQHAVEIAADPGTANGARVADLYERIGFASCSGGARCYETRAAKAIEARVSGEINSPPAMNTRQFGEWILDVELSSLGDCPAGSGRRYDRDRRHGLASSVVDLVDCAGIEHRDTLVFKVDGKDYPMTSPPDSPLRTIAFTLVDKQAVEFVVKEDGALIACGRRSVNKAARS